MTLCLAQDPAADELLSEDPLALLVGMLLDQQVPMERAFGAPAELARRLGVERLDAAAIAVRPPEQLLELFSRPPALHRFPGSMAGRVQALCEVIANSWGNDVTALWRDVPSGADLLARLQSLPGFGEQKARIFVALLGKQLGVRPPGWREAAGPYGEDGARRSVADVVDKESLLAVRSFKQEAKRRAKAARA